MAPNCYTVFGCFAVGRSFWNSTVFILLGLQKMTFGLGFLRLSDIRGSWGLFMAVGAFLLDEVTLQ